MTSGYYRVNTPAGGDPAVNPSSNSWDTAFRGNLVYLFDMNRGVEVLKVKNGGVSAARKMKAVVAPSLKRSPWAAKPVGGLARTNGGFVCPLFN